jgi:AcrR family transcriptional regulator
VRVKTDERRQRIIATAAQAFSELGVEQTSMSELALRMGSSKSTLYSYFSSKAELLLEVLVTSALRQADVAMEALDDKNDYRSTLQAFGRHYLLLLISPQFIAGYRAALVDGENSDLGKVFYARGPARLIACLERFLQSLIDKALLRKDDARLMAEQLIGLLEGPVLPRLLLGIECKVDVDDLAKATMQVFCRAYGPVHTASPAAAQAAPRLAWLVCRPAR